MTNAKPINNSKPIKLPAHLVSKAEISASVYSRSIPGQIAHWSKIGSIAEENPELNYNFIKDILFSLEESKQDEVEEYTFG